MTREDQAAELARYISILVESENNQGKNCGKHEELKTTPLFSWLVKILADSPTSSASNSTIGNDNEENIEEESQPGPFTQYALLGSELPPPIPRPVELFHESFLPCQPKELSPRLPPEPIFLNTNAPWSAFICGSQGSGKSYTMSCMLENCLLPIDKIGCTPNPLSGIVFHYDSHSADTVCEAAFLGTHVPVNVLCSPSNFYQRQALYENLPGTEGNINVFPLLLKDKHLNTQRMMRLMAFNDGEASVPLYMEVLISILKDMALDRAGKAGFSYNAFVRRVREEAFAKDQKGPLNLRLQLLESFMDTGARAKKIPAAKTDIFKGLPGSLTIVDLTDPFVDAGSACVLFDICLALALEDRSGVGKVIALDEAHKFMDSSAASSVFTQSLLQVIREQRHKGARVIISTQEPTISPKLLDLCSMTFVHRFTSPEWLATLRQHLAGASSTGGQSKQDLQDLFEKIVNLNVGESLLFSPSAFVNIDDDGNAQKLGMDHLTFKTRPRITKDGGRSIMATESSNEDGVGV